MLRCQPLANTDNWDGVTISPVDDDGDDTTPNVMRVTAVELADNQLTGSLSAEWAKLTALTTLDLSGNNLSGTVPRSVWSASLMIPETDETVSDLATLNLSGNPN